MNRIIMIFSLGLLGQAMIIQAHEPEYHAKKVSAKVYLIEPKDGQTVAQTFTVKFGLYGYSVVPAGTDKKNSGHHHLLIDTDSLPDMSKPLPKTDKLKHFGGGQTETELTLSPGKHTLQLLLGDYLHVPHTKPLLSEKITVIVK